MRDNYVSALVFSIILLLIGGMVYSIIGTNFGSVFAYVRRNVPTSLATARPTTYDPLIDGKASAHDEWVNATKVPDLFTDGVIPNGGFYYVEEKTSWNATSPFSGNSSVIPGLTVFVAHDINGYPTGDLRYFQTAESDDWNVMQFPTPWGLVTCWILAGANTLDDTGWLPSSGLSDSSLIPDERTGNDLINDTGYIVRLNNDTATDRHWFPGQPAPGDAGWLSAAPDYYWTFGNWNFSSSFFDVGLDASPYVNEEYEWAVTYYESAVTPKYCVWWEFEWVHDIDDKLWWQQWVLKGQIWLHYWPPPPPPPPTHDEFEYRIIELQIADLSDSILPTLPPDIRPEVEEAIGLLNTSLTQIESMPRTAMDTIGDAMHHLVNATAINLNAWNVMIHLLAVEQYITHTKLYQAENIPVRDPYNQNEFKNEIALSYVGLRGAGLEVEKIFESRQNYSTYNAPVDNFKTSWDHAQTAEDIANLPPIHDVAITAVTAYPTSTSQATISATATNEGTSSESFSVIAYYDNTAISSQAITDLAPGAQRTLYFYWDTRGVPTGTHTIKAEASTVPNETDTSDNMKIDGTITITRSHGPGGYAVPVDKLSLSAPYISLTFTIIAATISAVIIVKHVKYRKKRVVVNEGRKEAS